MKRTKPNVRLQPMEVTHFCGLSCCQTLPDIRRTLHFVRFAKRRPDRTDTDTPLKGCPGVRLTMPECLVGPYPGAPLRGARSPDSSLHEKILKDGFRTHG